MSCPTNIKHPDYKTPEKENGPFANQKNTTNKGEILVLQSVCPSLSPRALEGVPTEHASLIPWVGPRSVSGISSGFNKPVTIPLKKEHSFPEKETKGK